VFESIEAPVLIHDGLYRIICSNTAYLSVMGLDQAYLNTIPENDPTKYHIARHIYDPDSPVRKTYQSRITAVEMNSISYWRFLSLGHRHRPLFEAIQSQLLSHYQHFAHVWSSLNYRLIENDMTSLLRRFEHQHPELGLLNYLINSTRLYRSDRELFMTVLIPTNQLTRELFNWLVKKKDFKVVRFIDDKTS
jgi:hypothetical protein